MGLHRRKSGDVRLGGAAVDVDGDGWLHRTLELVMVKLPPTSPILDRPPLNAVKSART